MKTIKDLKDTLEAACRLAVQLGTELQTEIGEAMAYLDSLKVPAELEGRKLALKERIQWEVSSLTSHSYIMQGGK